MTRLYSTKPYATRISVRTRMVMRERLWDRGVKGGSVKSRVEALLGVRRLPRWWGQPRLRGRFRSRHRGYGTPGWKTWARLERARRRVRWAAARGRRP